MSKAPKMHSLVKNEDGSDLFQACITSQTDHTIEVSVFEVVAHLADGTPCEIEQYLRAYVKWDGCSHLWFGDEDGYLHLCGKGAWEDHARVLGALWGFCSENIVEFVPEIAE